MKQPPFRLGLSKISILIFLAPTFLAGSAIAAEKSEQNYCAQWKERIQKHHERRLISLNQALEKDGKYFKPIYKSLGKSLRTLPSPISKRMTEYFALLEKFGMGPNNKKAVALSKKLKIEFASHLGKGLKEIFPKLSCSSFTPGLSCSDGDLTRFNLSITGFDLSAVTYFDPSLPISMSLRIESPIELKLETSVLSWPFPEHIRLGRTIVKGEAFTAFPAERACANGFVDPLLDERPQEYVQHMTERCLPKECGGPSSYSTHFVLLAPENPIEIKNTDKGTIVIPSTGTWTVGDTMIRSGLGTFMNTDLHWNLQSFDSNIPKGYLATIGMGSLKRIAQKDWDTLTKEIARTLDFSTQSPEPRPYLSSGDTFVFRREDGKFTKLRVVDFEDATQVRFSDELHHEYFRILRNDRAKERLNLRIEWKAL